MTSVLSAFFARDPKSQFGYSIPPCADSEYDGAKLGSSFKKAEPDELATIFWMSGGHEVLKTQAQKLRTMRHPNILTYHDSIEVDQSFYLVTEKCQPLQLYMEGAGLSGSQKEFVVSWGLFQILSSLKFLHEAGISHGNLRRAVFVTAGGDWKIAGLQSTATFETAECDLKQLALLIWEVFNGFNEGITKLRPAGKIPERLTQLYKKLASPQVARLSAVELIQENRRAHGIFKNKFVDTLLFLEEFQLKEHNEKQSFFMHLRENLDIFPDDVAKYKILPKLIQTYEYGDAGPNILIPLFKLGRLLDEEEYQQRIVPCLVKLFGSPDRTTRLKLLERIDEFGAHISPAVLNDKIFGNLVSGFLDSSPALRESTVKAMVILAEKLNFHNLNVELMKYLARLQGGDDQGGIRTNTTICLGKIGCYLDPGKRQTILLSAFSRGFKDPFPPARLAAILAMSATQQYYSLADVANRVIPVLAPLTCDPEKQVRDQTFKALKGFMDKLEKASENPELIPEMEAQVKAGGRSILDSDKVPQWASWALKSLSGKFYKGTPPVESKGSPAGNEQTSEKGASPPPNAAASIRSGGHTGLRVPPSPTTTPTDGWGDEEDDLGDNDEWADAVDEMPNDMASDQDDWSTGWESTETSHKPPAAAVKKPIAVKKQIGRKSPMEEKISNLTLSHDTDTKLSSIEPGVSEWGTSNSGGWDDDWTETAETSIPEASNRITNSLPNQVKSSDIRRKKAEVKKLPRGALKLSKVEKKMDEDTFADW